MNLNKGRVKNSKKKNQGIALIEMLIVIGIIGLITAGIVALSTSVFRGMDEAEVVANLSTVKAKLQKGYKTQGDYAGVDSTVSGGVPSPLLDRTDMLNPFGADFVIDAVLTSGQTDGGIGVKVGGLGPESCRNLLTTIDSSSFDYLALETGAAGTVPDPFAGTDDIANTVAGTDVELYVQGGQEVKARDVATVDTDCDAAAASDNAILLVGFN